MKKHIAALALGVLTAAGVTEAKVTLPAIISDNMVLEQGTDARLWGKADPGEKITITPSWAAKSPVVTTAGADGRWVAYLPTPAATADAQTITFKGKNTVKVNNVLVGEVWLCTGQSNMLFPVGDHTSELKWQTGMVDAADQLKDADYPTMRLFTVPFVVAADAPEDDCQGRWVLCTPETAYDFSAVGFVFGRTLHNDLKCPVGLVMSAKGDTHAESWMKPELMLGNPFYTDVYAGFGRDVVKLSKKPFRIPSSLWNGMINPILGYTVKGNIWYQGEANAVRADKYQHVFTTLINSWRQEWGQPDMPFYFVQIAPFSRQPAEIREAQLDTWQTGLKNIGMVVTTDVGDSLDIHPRNKAIVGERLARWALNRDYGRDVACAGPVYRTMSHRDGKIVLTFDNAPQGLAAPMQGRPTGFFIAGTDRCFVPAEAEIDGNTVIVSSPDVPQPVAVRYGYDNFFHADLYNREGLPASPFRTDRWDASTVTRRQ